MLTRTKIDNLKAGDKIVARVNGYDWQLEVTHVHGTGVYGDALEPCAIGFYEFETNESLWVYYSDIIRILEAYDGERA